ncbi:MAG: gliding motility lipoprotein GldH [Bacteroidetes bacterium]|nr:gliding motility lipoprotein GldH [Bacteroidota bacterium]
MRNLFLLMAFAISLTACNPNRIYEKHHSLSDNEWVKGQKLAFQTSITDTGSKFDILITIRHAQYYPFPTVDVNIKTISPSGKETSKDYKLQLTDEDGMFKGDVMGEIWDIEIPVEEGFTFEQTGIYKFQMKHTMPYDWLPLIMEVGLIIEKSVNGQ